MARNPLIRNIKQATSKPLDHQSSGILDDHAIRKNLATKEGTIEQVPVDDNHIVNKKYVDDQFPVTHASTTGQTTDDHHAQVHTILSHDTDTTGAELTSLADNSIVDNLHRHTELVSPDGTPDPALSVIANGNVGIGTTIPEVNLHIAENGGGDLVASSDVMFALENNGASGLDAGLLISARANGMATLYFGQNGDGDRGRITYEGSSGIVTDKMSFWTNTNQQMVIDSNGNVGIGTTSPAYKLDVDGSDADVGLQINSNGAGNHDAGILLGETLDTGVTNRGFHIVHNGTTGNLDFARRDNSLTDTIAMSILRSNGNIGIGTTAPGARLDVKSSGTSDEVLKIIKSGDANPLFSIREDASSNSILRMYDGAGNEDIKLRTSGDSYFNGGNVGIGTTSPTQPLSVKEKSSMTAIGGFAIKLTNKTGANSVAGNLVKADTATNDAVILTAAGDTECFGVFLDAGIADGAEAWVVVSGIADVALDDNVASVRGDWMSTGVLAGYAATATSPAAAPTHFEEIGHCIETVAAGGAGTHILARCVLHFN